MFHAPTSQAKTETMQSKSQLKPMSERELHPHSFGAASVYAFNGAGSIAPVRPPEAQQRQMLTGMQSTHGNQAVLRMMQSPQQAARMPALRPSQSVMLQRKCACGGSSESVGECAECKAKREATLQRSVGNQVTSAAAPTIPPIVHDVLGSSGQPLDVGTRAYMEPRFGQDFSGVRVHTDTRAAESARAVNALAYTVGSNVVFGTGQYAPGTGEGRRLMAHELTHVVQQAGSTAIPGQLAVGSPGDHLERQADVMSTRVVHGDRANVGRSLGTADKQSLQRDLATEPPALPSPAQPDLTAAQIQEAISFNQARYDAANTRLIQDLLGGSVTGTWTAENIVAIAATQEEFGLHKDGKVGDATFRFLNREQRLEGMPTKTEDCLVSFRLAGPDTQVFGRDDPTHCHFHNHFLIEAQFSPRCNCDNFEYRQFVRGFWRRTRGGVVTDLPVRVPGGVVPAAFIEDTDTAAAVPHYGHRADPAEADPEDHYIDATNTNDQLHGCRFRMQDFPGFIVPFDDCLPGDQYDLFTTFRGEIQRNGAPIQSKFWTAINIVNWRP